MKKKKYKLAKPVRAWCWKSSDGYLCVENGISEVKPLPSYLFEDDCGGRVIVEIREVSPSRRKVRR